MNCRDIRSHFADHAVLNEFRNGTSELAEHLAACSECRRLIRMQKEVRQRLDLLKKAASSVPASLDEVVLTGFRKVIAEQRLSREAVAIRLIRTSPVLRATLAVAALVVIGAIGFGVYGTPTNSGRKMPVNSPTQIHRSTEQANREPVAKSATIGQQATSTRKQKKISREFAAAKTTIPVGSHAAPLPGDFRSLIYCDELICDGGMEIVHVQLAAVGRPVRASVPGGRLISADVLVGADGVARGIRIDQ